MFSLRTKLALGFGGLFAVTVLIGAYGLMLLGRLGPAIDVIPQENYRSVVAMDQLKESLERMDSGALYALLGYGEGSTRLRDEYNLRFRLQTR